MSNKIAQVNGHSKCAHGKGMNIFLIMKNI
jgi:hypothetical protein